MAPTAHLKAGGQVPSYHRVNYPLPCLAEQPGKKNFNALLAPAIIVVGHGKEGQRKIFCSNDERKSRSVV